MGRKRASYLARVSGMVHDWALYQDRLENSGYPHASIEARLMEGSGGPSLPGPRIPSLAWMDEHIRRVDRAIRIMPENHRTVLYAHYVTRKRVPPHKVTLLLEWLAGNMA